MLHKLNVMFPNHFYFCCRKMQLKTKNNVPTLLLNEIVPCHTSKLKEIKTESPLSHKAAQWGTCGEADVSHFKKCIYLL